MSQMLSAVFGGGDTPKASKAPTDTAGSKAQADALKRRQQGGLGGQTSTNSGFRQMVEGYNMGGKATLGAG